MRVFKFSPKSKDGSPSQCYKVGFGTVVAGQSIVIDPETEPDRLAYAEGDDELKEVKGKQAEDAIADLTDPEVGSEPVDEIATTHPDHDDIPVQGEDQPANDAPAGEESK